ncbi:MAG: hypothetical protein ACXQS8_00335, partial [Candidatus Helarchaeales archaeon]
MSDLKEVTCTGCSLLCDDVNLELSGSSIEHVYHACSKGYYLFKAWSDGSRLLTPQFREGDDAKLLNMEEAISRASELLKQASRVVIYGLNNSPNETIEAALDLGKKLGATVDSSSTYYKGRAVQAILESGLPVFNFKDLMDRGGRMIFWGSNPSCSHLRLASRYVILTRGELTQKGKEDRYVALIDFQKTQMRRLSDAFLSVKPG